MEDVAVVCIHRELRDYKSERRGGLMYVSGGSSDTDFGAGGLMLVHGAPLVR